MRNFVLRLDTIVVIGVLIPLSLSASVYLRPETIGDIGFNEFLADPPLDISGDANRYNHREGNDDYGQPRALFNIIIGGKKNERHNRKFNQSLHR